ncbi:hypothetical protein [Cyclobacterium xiamenense]|uniref:hypothetical protein n=1 Tax=Cyclobacterium xiamenense TaxID=1297121 RepID=UPI0035D07D3E
MKSTRKNAYNALIAAALLYVLAWHLEQSGVKSIRKAFEIHFFTHTINPGKV